MDCPSEESLIRMKLENNPLVRHLDFDLTKRILTVEHINDVETITNDLKTLNLGSKLQGTFIVEGNTISDDPVKQRKLLWIVLLINFSFFLIEIIAGYLSGSMGLIADSLDMLADALVYSMSLMAVGAAISKKKRVALLSGYLQITLAIFGLLEIIRRFIGLESAPEFRTMIIISALALAANAFCLWLLQRSRSKEAHIKAIVICSSNDVIINFGVIVAALFVWRLNSNIPDLIIGIIVFILVIRGAIRILKLAQ